MTTYGNDSVYACGGCRRHILCHNLASGNTFGATYWTDGRMIAPMLPRSSGIVKCRNCGHLLDRASAQEVGTRESRFLSSRDPDGFPDAQSAQDPSPSDLVSYAEQKSPDIPQELHTRIWAWWLWNDTHRSTDPRDPNANGPDIEPEMEIDASMRDNLARVLELLDRKSPENILMRAEIQRELGNFEDTLLELEASLPDTHRPVREQLIRLCRRHDRRVQQIGK